MVLPSLVMGGMERMVAQLALRLHARNWTVGVTCVSDEGELFADLHDQGIAVRLNSVGTGAWLGPRSLVRQLTRDKPAVLHTHSGFWLRGMMAGVRARIARRLHTVHGLYIPEPWTFPVEIKIAGRLSTRIVAVSHEIRRHLLNRGALAERHVTVIPNGVDTDTFQPGRRSGLRERHGIPTDAVVVGTVARLNEIKNLVMVIATVAACSRHGLDIHFVAVGDGPDRERLDAVAARCGVTDRVHITGMVTTTNAWYREFDYFVNSSFKEGTSLSVLEAMATGLPCVATDVGGNSDVLAAGDAGVLVPSDDVAAMTEAFVALNRDPARRQTLGLAARRRAVGHYSLDAMVSSYERLYVGEAALG
ncbi:MAG: glycosyltransferase family 4 protein [Gemmatimonadales bacterium]|nr:glycosyltransferase family 4 protein [Gemmatimonadales bacterium]MDZ4388997.1 glycosyltransferase family 4 protein [Gemmatimonadales bacterium]